MLNVGWWPLYYVTGGPLNFLRASEQDMYEHWSPAHFEGPYTPRWVLGAPLTAFDLAADDFRNLGATIAVWNDDPSSPGAKPAALLPITSPTAPPSIGHILSFQVSCPCFAGGPNVLPPSLLTATYVAFQHLSG